MCGKFYHTNKRAVQKREEIEFLPNCAFNGMEIILQREVILMFISMKMHIDYLPYILLLTRRNDFSWIWLNILTMLKKTPCCCFYKKFFNFVKLIYLHKTCILVVIIFIFKCLNELLNFIIMIIIILLFLIKICYPGVCDQGQGHCY